MARLYYIRHADAYDLAGLQLDNYSLNPAGVIQAKQLAKRLENNVFGAVYCSEIKRSVETCNYVNRLHKHEVQYTNSLNEVGEVDWPQPSVITREWNLKGFSEAAQKTYSTHRELCLKHVDQEIAVFTHGNWIRALLTQILANGDPRVFPHFVIHNTSMTIIDFQDDFEHIITVSDAAHNYLFNPNEL